MRPHLQRFLLTRLLRGATPLVHACISGTNISTHTPLTRRDVICHSTALLSQNFYSHASYEARLASRGRLPGAAGFLLTRLLRGATATYSTCSYRTSYIQEADSKIIAKYMINLNILYDSVLKSRRTSLSYTHHLTFACYSP